MTTDNWQAPDGAMCVQRPARRVLDQALDIASSIRATSADAFMEIATVLIRVVSCSEGLCDGRDCNVVHSMTSGLAVHVHSKHTVTAYQYHLVCLSGVRPL